MDLFNEHIYLVDILVNKLCFDVSLKDDLYQAGLMGLYQATKMFDEKLNFSFKTYAPYYIISEIKKELRESKLIKYSKKMYKAKRLLMENKSIEEVSNQLNVRREFVMDAYLDYTSIVYLENDSDVQARNNLNVFDIAKQCLDGIYKDIIKLKYIDCYSQGEIGKIFSLSQSKISRMEKIALKKIKDYIDKYNHTL